MLLALQTNGLRFQERFVSIRSSSDSPMIDYLLCFMAERIARDKKSEMDILSVCSPPKTLIIRLIAQKSNKLISYFRKNTQKERDKERDGIIIKLTHDVFSICLASPARKSGDNDSFRARHLSL
jgi:hypothetical protein